MQHQLENDKYSHKLKKYTFVINCIKLGHNNRINLPNLPRFRPINQTLVKRHKLIDPIITNQGLPNENNQIRLIKNHQFGELHHERFIVLHSPSSID